MSLVAGTRAPIQAKKYFQEAAKPKQIFPPDPPMRMPTTSVAMLRRRARAELAQQGGFPPEAESKVLDMLKCGAPRNTHRALKAWRTKGDQILLQLSHSSNLQDLM